MLLLADEPSNVWRVWSNNLLPTLLFWLSITGWSYWSIIKFTLRLIIVANVGKLYKDGSYVRLIKKQDYCKSYKQCYQTVLTDLCVARNVSWWYCFNIADTGITLLKRTQLMIGFKYVFQFKFITWSFKVFHCDFSALVEGKHLGNRKCRK